MSLGEGGLAGLVRIDGTTSPVALEMSVDMKKAALGLVGGVLQTELPWTGQADGALRASSKGTTIRSLLALNGSANLIATKAQIDASSLALQKRESFRQILAPEGQTALSCLAIDADLKDGDLNIENGTLVTRQGRLGAQGHIDLQHGAFDINFVSAPDAGPDRLVTKRSHVAGTLGALEWQDDVLERRWLSLVKPAAACVVDAVAPR
jgi:hypothetical protein